MNWLRNFMMGRYARLDQLNIALFFAYIILTVIRLILGFVFRASSMITLFQAGLIVYGVIVSVLFLLQTVAVVLFLFRIFSRNINRRMAENQKFVGWFSGFKSGSDYRQKKRQAREQGKALFRCPTCRKPVRVPFGHGKIEITCPNCGRKFIKKT